MEEGDSATEVAPPLTGRGRAAVAERIGGEMEGLECERPAPAGFAVTSPTLNVQLRTGAGHFRRCYWDLVCGAGFSLPREPLNGRLKPAPQRAAQSVPHPI